MELGSLQPSLKIGQLCLQAVSTFFIEKKLAVGMRRKTSNGIIRLMKLSVGRKNYLNLMCLSPVLRVLIQLEISV
jgi:hypothetical protein